MSNDVLSSKKIGYSGWVVIKYADNGWQRGADIICEQPLTSLTSVTSIISLTSLTSTTYLTIFHHFCIFLCFLVLLYEHADDFFMWHLVLRVMLIVKDIFIWKVLWQKYKIMQLIMHKMIKKNIIKKNLRKILILCSGDKK